MKKTLATIGVAVGLVLDLSAFAGGVDFVGDSEVIQDSTAALEDGSRALGSLTP